jgi:hypothetical protein
VTSNLSTFIRPHPPRADARDPHDAVPAGDRDRDGSFFGKFYVILAAVRPGGWL